MAVSERRRMHLPVTSLLLILALIGQCLAFLPYRLERKHQQQQRLRLSRNHRQFLKYHQQRQQQRQQELEQEEFERRLEAERQQQLLQKQEQQQHQIEQQHLVEEVLSDRSRQQQMPNPFEDVIIGPDDDISSSCCPRGLKSTNNVMICEAPCCPGLEEHQKEAPLLGLMSWCNTPEAST